MDERLIEPLEAGTPSEELRDVLYGPVTKYYDEHRVAIDEVVKLAREENR